MYVKKNNIVACICCVYCLFSFYGCKKESETKEDMPSVTVKTMPVITKKLQEDLSSFGTVSYKTKNDITSLVEGTIINLYVKEGDAVLQGQRIGQLRNVQLEIQKEQSENALESAKASLFLAETKMQEERLRVESRLLSLEQSALKLQQMELELLDAMETFENKRQLHEIGGITDSAFKSLQLSISAKQVEINMLKKEREIASLGLRDEDLLINGYLIAGDPLEKKKQLIELNTRTVAAEIEAARAGLKNAQKSLDAVQKLVDELTIRTSVSGIVGAKYYENGEYVKQNEKFATIMDISTVHAVFYIQEQDSIFFSLGNPLIIELPSFDRKIASVIHEISPMADPQSGNFTVKAEIKNTDERIKPGMFVKCTIPKRSDSIYPVVPETAILQRNENTAVVFCVVNGFAVLKNIQVHTQKDGLVWVSNGLKEGDLIVDKPSPFLKEGDLVRD